MTCRNYPLLQRMAAGVALVAMIALILQGALHIAGHVGHFASHAIHHHHHASTMLAADHGSDVRLPKHDHTAHHPLPAPEPASDPDGGLCCCTSVSCMPGLLPAASAAVRYAVPHHVLAGLQGNQEAQFRPEGPRRPPRPRLIA